MQIIGNHIGNDLPKCAIAYTPFFNGKYYNDKLINYITDSKGMGIPISFVECHLSLFYHLLILGYFDVHPSVKCKEVEHNKYEIKADNWRKIVKPNYKLYFIKWVIHKSQFERKKQDRIIKIFLEEFRHRAKSFSENAIHYSEAYLSVSLKND